MLKTDSVAPLLRVEVTPRAEYGEDYVVDDCEYVSFINSGTFGIPGGGGRDGSDGTLIRRIKNGNKVLFINTETVGRLTIEQQEG